MEELRFNAYYLPRVALRQIHGDFYTRNELIECL